MQFLSFTLILLASLANAGTSTNTKHRRCRAQPGDPSFPTPNQLAQLNSSIGGRLVKVVPSAQFCKLRKGGCTDAEWGDSVFRSNIPGAMDQVNWEQDYTSQPPSLCFRNSSVCGQGSVPVYAINATLASHIQVNITPAIIRCLTYMPKGREFSGSGVGLRAIYQATKAQGKVFVGGSTANVVAAGGYIQGGGHSALSPLLGLAADNALEFQVVIANGDIITTNEVTHPDLFWALRGGGAGSWGVIISATLRTFPTFDAVFHSATINVNLSSAAGRLATLHAQHIFDWDNFNVGQYFFLVQTSPTWMWSSISVFPNSSIAVANASLRPFMEAVVAEGFNISEAVNLTNFNDALSLASSDPSGGDAVIGSRLVPADVYRHNATAVGETYQRLLDTDPDTSILGHLVAGGQVSKNSRIDSAVNPKWRTAKTHVVLGAGWDDDTPSSVVESIREELTQRKVPILAELAGLDSGSYSNEADVREPKFQTAFFGPNYARLSAVKGVYDPNALFIVGGGVGSEKWDTDGLCRIA